MADYFNHSIIQPLIPKQLITAQDKDIIEAFGFVIDDDGPAATDLCFIFADDWCSSATVISTNGEEIELCEEDLFTCFQRIIRRSDGALTWISKENAYTCSQMRPDGFGGSAIFITKDNVQYASTSEWLEKRIEEAEPGATGL